MIEGGSKILVTANNNGNAPLNQGESLSITFTAHSPSEPGDKVWTVQAWKDRFADNDPVNLISGGSQPTVTITCEQEDTEPPETTITFDPATPNGLNGWYTSNVQVTLSASDTGSGVASTEYSLSSATGPWTAYAGPFDVADEGTTVIYYRSTDNAGNVESIKSASIQIDKTLPMITASATKADGTAYTADTWTNQDVTVHFTCSDGGSGVDSCPADVLVSDEGITASVERSVSDKAGNSASASFGPIKIDKTAPTLAWGTASPAANAAGWNNTDVSIPFTAGDALSGVDATSPASPLVLTAEGDAVTGTVTVTDVAGNSKTFTSPAVKIDKTAPELNIDAPREGEYNVCTPPRRPRFSPTDSLSGLDGSEGDKWDTSGRTYIYTAHATDVAGNTSVETRTYTLIAGCNRVDVSVILHGAWTGTPVDAYVGGTRQETLFTAPDAMGRQAVLWTFYPPRCSDERWSVSVAPQLPAGLESPRWQYRLIQVESPDSSQTSGSLQASVAIERCREYILHFQLVDTGPVAAAQSSGGPAVSSAGGVLEVAVQRASEPAAAIAVEPAASMSEVVFWLGPEQGVSPEAEVEAEVEAGAAHEVASPSLLERIAAAWQWFVGWLRSLFGR